MTIKLIAGGSTAFERRIKKWGLSFLIDDDLLFDTFCSAELLKASCEKYHIEPKKIRHVVLSHEHWDHTGGLWWLLGQQPKIRVYTGSRFSRAFKEKAGAYGAALVETAEPVQIKDGIFTSGEIEGSYRGQPLFEQALILRQQDTLAVITGCAHPGILKMLTYIGREFREPIVLLTGGLHLMNQQPEDIAQITTVLDAVYRIKSIAPFHCTGKRAIRYMKKNIPHSYMKITAGDCFHFNKDSLSRELSRSNKKYGSNRGADECH